MNRNSDRNNPQIPFQKVPDSLGCIAVFKYKNYLYTAGENQFSVYDISEPLKPELLRVKRGIGLARQFALSGNTLFLTAREFGVWSFDLSDPGKPKLLGNFDTVELATGITAAGNLLFITQRVFGVEILDISDPRNLRHLSLIRTQEAQSAAYADGCLYVGNWGEATVEILDVHNPFHPFSVAKEKLGGFGDGIAVSGHYCYAATGHDGTDQNGNTLPWQGHGLDIFRIRKNKLEHVSRLAFPSYPTRDSDFWTVRVSGTMAFVADTHNGVFVADVKNPAKPVVTGHIELPEVPVVDLAQHKVFQIPDCAGSLALGKGVIYIAGKKTGLHIAKIPSASEAAVLPQKIRIPKYKMKHQEKIPGFRRYNLNGQVRRVYLDGNTLYAACSHAGIKIFEMETNSIRETGCIPARCAYDVRLHNHLIVSAEGTGGLAIYTKDGREIGRWQHSGTTIQVLHISKNGRFACCGCRGGILRILDISDPSAPRFVYCHHHGGQLYGDTFPEQDWDDTMPMIWPYHGLSWYDFSKGKVKLIYNDREHITGQFEGITLFQGRYLVNTMDKKFLFFDPVFREQPPVICDAEGCSGIPSVDKDVVAFSNKAGGFVRLYQFDRNSARELVHRGVSGLHGTPDRVIFYHGRLVIPAGNQGLLIENPLQ